MKRMIAPLLASALLAGCSVFGVRSGYEQPPYEVVATIDESIEVREYAPRVAVEARADTSDDDAFRLLFDYISGANRSDAQIEMTTPVETAKSSEEISMTVPVETSRSGDGGVRMRFFLPAAYTAKSAPEPLDPRLSIVEVPAQTVAVLRFSGFGGDAAIAAKTDELRDALQGSSYRQTADPFAYFYDPPWTLPFLRRNEVVVPVAG